jgi:hypothetical protein
MDQLNFLINRICKLTHITCNTDNVDIGFISINFAKYYHTYFMIYLLKVSKQLIDIRQATVVLVWSPFKIVSDIPAMCILGFSVKFFFQLIYTDDAN